MARSALSAGVQLLSHGIFADVQISQHPCKHPRVLPKAACFCAELGLVGHRQGIITTHPTHPTVAHCAGPAKRGQSRKDRRREADKDARPRVVIRFSATLLIEQRR